jgi:hypothetical protein
MTSLVRRVAYTPLRDIVRLRLTGRLDRRAVLEASGLPPDVRDLVRNVTRRTRLRRLERADVTRELVAHFHDALDAGVTGEEAVRSFGDQRLAARLIRRAKIRQRGIVAMVCRRAMKSALAGLLLLICVYAYFGLRFFMGSPTVTRDYLAELNAPALGVPESERAWPIYREAKLALTDAPDEMFDKAWFSAASFDDAEFIGLTRAYVEANKAAIDLVREAGAKPAMGAVLSHNADVELNPEWAGAGNPLIDDSLMSVLLPQLGVMRLHARILAADAFLATLEDDDDRVMADFEAFAALGGHCGELPTLIADLTSIAILHYFVQTVGDVIQTDPSLLSEAQLARLAHLIAARLGDHATLLDWRTERRSFDDVVQRTYTDNGHGDGHLVFEGLKHLVTFSSLADTSVDLNASALVVGPIAGAVGPSRADLVHAADQLYAHAESLTAAPLWTWSEALLASPLGLDDDPVQRLRYQPLLMVEPAYEHSAFARQVLLQHRDATLATIALTIYRIKEGAYPATLEALSPALMPSPPVDRFDGAALRYRLEGDRPLLYSVGPDRADDGGSPIGRRMMYDVWAAFHGLEGKFVTPEHRGDWVLWPRPQDPPDSN